MVTHTIYTYCKNTGTSQTFKNLRRHIVLMLWLIFALGLWVSLPYDEEQKMFCFAW